MKKDPESVTTFLLKVKVKQESIHTMFNAPNENEVYKRAFRRLRDGHIDVESLTLMKARCHDSGEEICVLTAQIAASLRWVCRCVTIISVCIMLFNLTIVISCTIVMIFIFI